MDLFATKPEPRGKRLPEDWQPTFEQRRFAESFGLEWTAVADKFRDYWIAIPGQRGRKACWNATWRNWVRTEAERAPRAGRKFSPEPSVTVPQNSQSQWEARLRGYKGPRSLWSPFWGPRPGEEGCLVPGPILARWRASCQ